MYGLDVYVCHMPTAQSSALQNNVSLVPQESQTRSFNILLVNLSFNCSRNTKSKKCAGSLSCHALRA